MRLLLTANAVQDWSCIPVAGFGYMVLSQFIQIDVNAASWMRTSSNYRISYVYKQEAGY